MKCKCASFAPGPSIITVRFDRLEIGRVGAIEIGRAMIDRAASASAMNRSDHRQNGDTRPTNVPRSAAHTDCQDEGGHAAFVFAQPAARAVVAQIQAERQHRPQRQCDRRDPDPARGQQVDRNSQYAPPPEPWPESAAGARAACRTEPPAASSRPESASEKTGRPRRDSSRQAARPGPSRPGPRGRPARPRAAADRPVA